jgi:CYTH domain-containing protein
MAQELELEVSYLAASIPAGLASCPSKELFDVYFPSTVKQPRLRIRKKGDSYELTKKTPADPNDLGAQTEENIMLTPEEFEALAQAPGASLRKTRYYMPYQGRTAEVDVFHDSLEGLVVVEFEFDDPKEKNAFTMPDFCLADVTQDDAIAGGILAGKSFTDVAPFFVKYGYRPIKFAP